MGSLTYIVGLVFVVMRHTTNVDKTAAIIPISCSPTQMSRALWWKLSGLKLGQAYFSLLLPLVVQLIGCIVESVLSIAFSLHHSHCSSRKPPKKLWLREQEATRGEVGGEPEIVQWQVNWAFVEEQPQCDKCPSMGSLGRRNRGIS